MYCTSNGKRLHGTHHQSSSSAEQSPAGTLMRARPVTRKDSCDDDPALSCPRPAIFPEQRRRGGRKRQLQYPKPKFSQCDGGGDGNCEKRCPSDHRLLFCKRNHPTRQQEGTHIRHPCQPKTPPSPRRRDEADARRFHNVSRTKRSTHARHGPHSHFPSSVADQRRLELNRNSALRTTMKFPHPSQGIKTTTTTKGRRRRQQWEN